MIKKLLLVSAVALVNSENKILLAKRPLGKEMAGLWEFPGGKIEDNETPEDALIREIKEELNIIINKKNLKPVSFASHEYKKFNLFMPFYLCQKWSGNIKPLEQQLCKWVSIDDMKKYDMPQADIPLVLALKRFF